MAKPRPRPGWRVGDGAAAGGTPRARPRSTYTSDQALHTLHGMLTVYSREAPNAQQPTRRGPGVCVRCHSCPDGEDVRVAVRAHLVRGSVGLGLGLVRVYGVRGRAGGRVMVRVRGGERVGIGWVE